MDQQFYGLPVEGDGSRLGVVVGVENDPATGATRLIVEGMDGSRHTLQSDMFAVRDDRVYVHDTLAFSQARMHAQTGGTQPLQSSDIRDIAPGEEIHIPIIREDVVIQTQQIERGGVRVHKLVNERTETVEQPTIHDHVDVERVAIGRVVEGDAVPQARSEGDTLIIPVLEEMLVVEKRLVLKEEVRITKRRTEDMEQVQVVLREEDVQIERIEGDQATFDQPGAASL